MKWDLIPATPICAALSCSGDYMISHRPEAFNVLWRPPGRHVHLDTFKTLEKAKAVTEAWDKGPKETYAMGLTEYAVGPGFSRWWETKQ